MMKPNELRRDTQPVRLAQRRGEVRPRPAHADAAAKPDVPPDPLRVSRWVVLTNVGPANDSLDGLALSRRQAAARHPPSWRTTFQSVNWERGRWSRATGGGNERAGPSGPGSSYLVSLPPTPSPSSQA